jgi:hypothetical protein
MDDNIACDNGVIGLVDNNEADLIDFVDGSRVEGGIVNAGILAVLPSTPSRFWGLARCPEAGTEFEGLGVFDAN